MRVQAALLGLLLLAGAALAQQPRTGLAPLRGAPPPAAAAAPDLLAGREVAIGPEAHGFASCLLCHGLQGEAEGSGAFPRLAGQPAWYLFKQLQDYAAGRRPNEVMGPIAQAMTPAQMQDVSAWYAAQLAPVPPEAGASSTLLQRGGAIAAAGIPARGVASCASCHGAQGEGAAPGVPALAGQYAPYTELQLRLWKQGVRRNDPFGVMAQVAAGMTEQDIVAVATYYASLRPAAGSMQAGR